MAYSDIQNKVGQTQMANQILIAQSREDRDDARKKKKQRINQKKQVDAANKRNEEYLKEESKYYRGQDPNAKIFNRDGQEVADDGSIIVDDSPVTGPVIEPAEGDVETDAFGNPVYDTINDLMKIGAGAAGFGGNILRMLINPLGGNALASTPQDGRTPTRLFYNNPYPDSRPDVFIKDEQMKKDAKKRFKLNTGIDLAGAQDIDTKMHILPSGMMVDENGIKYIWSPREQMFKDMGPYDPYYDGLPIPMGQRNSEMKIYGT